MNLVESTRGPITRAQINEYAAAVDDFNPVHVDEEFAIGAGLPSVIAHGPLTVALALDAVVAQIGPDALRSATARRSRSSARSRSATARRRSSCAMTDRARAFRMNSCWASRSRGR